MHAQLVPRAAGGNVEEAALVLHVLAVPRGVLRLGCDRPCLRRQRHLALARIGDDDGSVLAAFHAVHCSEDDVSAGCFGVVAQPVGADALGGE